MLKMLKQTAKETAFMLNELTYSCVEKRGKFYVTINSKEYAFDEREEALQEMYEAMFTELPEETMRTLLLESPSSTLIAAYWFDKGLSEYVGGAATQHGLLYFGTEANDDEGHLQAYIASPNIHTRHLNKGVVPMSDVDVYEMAIKMVLGYDK